MHFSGAIFDVDDTILSNYPDDSGIGMHERSRLTAAHTVGKRHHLPALQAFTIKEAADAFLNAKEHSLQAACWQMLIMADIVPDSTIEPSHPLLREIMTLKDELHENLLRTKGQAVPGAIAFIAALSAQGIAGKMAIASTSYRRDIDIVMEKFGLVEYFPNTRIISREQFTHPKPHPEPFNLAFASLKLPDSARPHTLAFEDDPRGIMSAKTAGLFTCAITTRYSRDKLAALEIAPDLIADSFAEFTKILGLSAKV